MITKAVEAKTPKCSYTVGFDAKCAELVSKLPFDVVNKIITAGMKKKFG